MAVEQETYGKFKFKKPKVAAIAIKNLVDS